MENFTSNLIDEFLNDSYPEDSILISHQELKEYMEEFLREYERKKHRKVKKQYPKFT